MLRDLSFNVERGTSLAILGPNGAGKTVLFRSLVGATPVEGIVRWAAATRIGYVPQKLDSSVTSRLRASISSPHGPRSRVARG